MTDRRWRLIRALPRILRWWLVSRFGTEALHRAPGFPTPLFLHPEFRGVGSLGLYVFGAGSKPGFSFLPHLLRPGDAVFDGGAGQGAYAVYAAALVGPTGRVVAVEPEAYAARALRISAAAAGFEHLRCLEAVVREAPGTAAFHTEGSPAAVAIRSVSIDAIAREQAMPRVGLIRLDGRSSEIGALQGAETVLARDRPFLLLEGWPGEGGRSAAAAQHLRDRGFALFDIVGAERIQASDQAPGGSPDMLAAPVERRQALARFQG